MPNRPGQPDKASHFTRKQHNCSDAEVLCGLGSFLPTAIIFGGVDVGALIHIGIRVLGLAWDADACVLV